MLEYKCIFDRKNYESIDPIERGGGLMVWPYCIIIFIVC